MPAYMLNVNVRSPSSCFRESAIRYLVPIHLHIQVTGVPGSSLPQFDLAYTEGGAAGGAEDEFGLASPVAGGISVP